MLGVMHYSVFALTGVGLGLIAVIIAVAYRVLRPPQRLGFVVGHVIGIGLGVGGALVLLAELQLGHLGYPPTWRLPATAVVIAVIDLSLIAVYRVERSRLVDKRAALLVT